MMCEHCGDEIVEGDSCVMVADAVATSDNKAEKMSMGEYIVYCTDDECLKNIRGDGFVGVSA